jgi:hypothetical protein
MFALCTRNYAVMANLRCGSTNMFNYFGIDTKEFGMQNWKQHHNPIIVLRNPLDRLVSSLPFFGMNSLPDQVRPEDAFINHSKPYLHIISAVNFRIIDFYDLEQYIPRNTVIRMQSLRTNTRCSPSTTAKDVYVENVGYTLQDLEREFGIYQELMTTREKITVEEWKELTQ